MSDGRTGVHLSLDGQAFVVTGGSGGIGAAITQELSDAGARVANLDLREQDTKAEFFVECDLGQAASIGPAVERCLDVLGRIDGVVHCAGITADGVLWKLPTADWDRVLQVNLGSAFHLLQAAIPALRKQGGSVVLVTSINGERGKFGQSNYAASKGGLTALAKTAARELGRFDVRVNCVAPGMVDTPMAESLPEEVKERARKESVLNRIATPADVAGVVLFLCSRLSRHITGQTIRVDGGQLIA